MKSKDGKPIRACAAFFAGFFLCSPYVHAADYVWIGADGGSWADGTNWSRISGTSGNAEYPVSGDLAVFMPGEGVSITVNGQANIARISVSNGTVTVKSPALDSYHWLQRETLSEGGRHPCVYVAEGATFKLSGAHLHSRGDETITKAGGGTMIIDDGQIANSRDKPYYGLHVEGGVLKAGDRIYVKEIVIANGGTLYSTLPYITTFDVSTNISVEVGGTLRLTGSSDPDEPVKQRSLMPVKGEGTLDISGWIAMESSQLADFTGKITGTGGLVTEGDVDFRNLSMSGGQLVPGGTTRIFGGESRFAEDMISFADDNVELIVKGGFMHAAPIDENVNAALSDYRGILVNGSGAPTATLRVEGGRVHIAGGNESGLTPGRLELAGGVTEIVYSKYTPNPSMTAENPAVVLFDGGEAVISLVENTRYHFYPFGSETYDTMSLQVGEGGAAFDTRGTLADAASSIHMCQPFVTADGVTADGGFTRKGGGVMGFYQPLSLNGPVSLLDGINMIASPSALLATPAFFGSGAFTMRDSVLDWSDDFTAASSVSIAAGKTFTYAGAVKINIADTKTSPANNVSFGQLVRAGKGAVMQVADRTYGLLDGGGSRIFFEGGLATNAAGLVAHPIFVHVDYGWPRYVAFATYDDATGLRGMTNYLDNSISADTGDRIVRIVNANYSVPAAGGACAALFLRQRILTISAGRTVKVGDGVNPAPVVFGMGTAGGAGTLDFGTSEGVVYVADPGKTIPWKITGSNGVTFSARPDVLEFDTVISGENEYTGGTWISGGDVTPGNASAFGDGKVTVLGAKRIGGCVNFAVPLVMRNDFSISGYGKAEQHRGALSFEAGAVLEGDVEIDGFARIGVQSNVLAEITGQVSGGSLEVRGAEGTLALSSANTYTGGTLVSGGVTLRLSTAESAGTGDVILDGSVLEISGNDRDSVIVFTNRIDGAGRIRVKGKSPVRFTGISADSIDSVTVYPGTDVSFPVASETDVIVSDPPPARSFKFILK